MRTYVNKDFYVRNNYSRLIDKTKQNRIERENNIESQQALIKQYNCKNKKNNNLKNKYDIIYFSYFFLV